MISGVNEFRRLAGDACGANGRTPQLSSGRATWCGRLRLADRYVVQKGFLPSESELDRPTSFSACSFTDETRTDRLVCFVCQKRDRLPERSRTERRDSQKQFRNKTLQCGKTREKIRWDKWLGGSQIIGCDASPGDIQLNHAKDFDQLDGCVAWYIARHGCCC